MVALLKTCVYPELLLPNGALLRIPQSALMNTSGRTELLMAARWAYHEGYLSHQAYLEHRDEIFDKAVTTIGIAA